MTQPTPSTCRCSQRKKADYCYKEIYNEWVGEHTPVEFDEWLHDKFKGKIISIYFND